MSFTIEDAQTLAESWFDEDLYDIDVLKWGNEFIRNIVSDKIWPETTQDFKDVKAGISYSLPTDFYRTVKVEDSDGVLFSGYAINNYKITFTLNGTYTLAYVPYPTALIAMSGEGNEVPLPDAFLYPLAEFLVFRQYNVGTDDKDRKMFANEYDARFRTSLKKIYDSMEINSQTESFQTVARW